LALLCHAFSEPAVDWNLQLAGRLAVLGIGPMGGAFFLWDAALKRGDARSLGSLAYLTPLLSTVLLGVTGYGRLGWSTAAALILIVGGAILGSRKAAAPGSLAPDHLAVPDDGAAPRENHREAASAQGTSG
jgi:drug/metabolite transporter (DMT)-like permease